MAYEVVEACLSQHVTPVDVPCSGMTLQNNIITKRGRLTLSSTAKYIMSLVECKRLI